jgi:hypothetical protein
MYIYFLGYILFFLIAVLDLDKTVQDEKYTNLRIQLFSLLTLFLIFFVGFRAIGSGIDDQNYQKLFNMARHGIVYKEISFFLVSNLLGNLTYVFLFFAIVGVGLKGIYIIKNSKYIGLTFLLYYSSYFFLHDFVEIRAGIASALILWILYSAGKKSYVKCLLLCLLAVSFHLSALCIVPIIFLKNKNSKNTFIILGLISLLLAFVFPLDILKLISYLPDFLYKRLSYYLIPEVNTEVNLLNPISLIHYGLVIIIFIYWGKLVAYSDSAVFIIKTFLIGVYLFLIFHNLSIVFRIYELLLIVQIPLADILINGIKQKYVMIPGVFLLSILYLFYYVIKEPVVTPYSFFFLQ